MRDENERVLDADADGCVVSCVYEGLFGVDTRQSDGVEREGLWVGLWGANAERVLCR